MSNEADLGRCMGWRMSTSVFSWWGVGAGVFWIYSQLMEHFGGYSFIRYQYITIFGDSLCEFASCTYSWQWCMTLQCKVRISPVDFGCPKIHALESPKVSFQLQMLHIGSPIYISQLIHPGLTLQSTTKWLCTQDARSTSARNTVKCFVDVQVVADLLGWPCIARFIPNFCDLTGKSILGLSSKWF